MITGTIGPLQRDSYESFSAAMQAWTNQLIISQMEGQMIVSQHISLQFVG
jgi:hypothetical protein